METKSLKRCKSVIRMVIATLATCMVAVMCTSRDVSHAASAKDSKQQTVAPASTIQKPGSTSSSPTIAPSLSPAAAVALPLPDLIVERIWLDNQCRINFQLKNNGAGSIPEERYRLGMVRLFIGSQELDYSLVQAYEGRQAVDSAGSLKQPKGVISFNTGQRLETQRLVRVWIDSTEKIAESNDGNNTGRESLTPNCPAVAGPAQATAEVSSAAAATARTTAQMPQATLAITSFRLHRSTSAGMMQMRSTGSDTEPSYSATVAAGEPCELRWIVEGCRAPWVTTQLRGYDVGSDRSTHTSPHFTETRQDKGDGCFTIIGSSSRPGEMKSTDYVLSIRATGPGAGTAMDEKTFRVNVTTPRLVLDRPEVNERDLTVTFYVVNRGAAYPATGANIRGGYTITNWNRHITYASGSIDQRNINIPRDGRVEVARITLTDREHLYAASRILIEASADDDHHYFTDRTISHTHEWATRTITLDSSILLGFFDALSGEIRLNNYRSPNSNTTTNRPVVQRDSYIKIGTFEKTFTPEFISIKLTGKTSGDVLYDYRPYINNLTASIGGRRTSSIPDRNIVKMRITFDTSGGPEIKGWRFRDNRFIDDDAPDINLTNLILDINYHLNLRSGRIVVDQVWIVPTLNFTVEQAFSWILNEFRPWLERLATNNIATYLREYMDTDELRRRLNDEISGALAVLNVSYVNNFELNSSGLTINYVPRR